MKRTYVKQYFEQALFELLKKKPMQTISITDLVEKSGASRASFYRNYSSKEAVIEDYLSNIFKSVNQNHRFSMENIRPELLSAFEELYRERIPLSILNSAGLLGMIDRYLYQATMDQILYLNILHDKYQPFFFAGAASSLIKAWIIFGFEESPEEITDIFLGSLNGYLQLR